MENMKIRIIERNDGLFQYEFGYKDHFDKSHPFLLWDRCEHLRFKTEEEARKHALEMTKFITAAATKRIIEEIDIG